MLFCTAVSSLENAAQLIVISSDSSESTDFHRGLSLSRIVWRSALQCCCSNAVRQLPGCRSLHIEAHTDYVFREQLHPAGRCMKKS